MLAKRNCHRRVAPYFDFTARPQGKRRPLAQADTEALRVLADDFPQFVCHFGGIASPNNGMLYPVESLLK